MKNVCILGSTGSIGKQTIEVVNLHKDKYNVVGLSANNNSKLLIEQAKLLFPKKVHIANSNKYQEVKDGLVALPIEVLTGEDGLNEIATIDDADIVVAAIVGFAGLIPTLEAVKAGKTLALANKETLVVAGDLLTKLAAKNNVDILPVDSEHSAIFQIMVGEDFDRVRRIILTASGGPFKNYSKRQLEKVKVKDALNHPNWSMGDKITIDSATLMNKGFEVIEAYWLFKMPPFKIDVVVHPQSVIHSFVEFKDRSIKAQLGLPDMRVPIQYALSYPDRLKTDFPVFDFLEHPTFTFEKPNNENFPALNIAYEAIREGGNVPCIVNAANEVAVSAFLNNEISFMKISDVIQKTMLKCLNVVNPSIEELISTNTEARKIALEIINKIK